MTARKATKYMKEKLAEYGLCYSQIQSKTVSFQDLARGSRVFTTIVNLRPWTQVARDLCCKVAKKQGFSVEFSNITGFRRLD